MTIKELRSKFIQFFILHNHKEITGASLLPDNDPTVLFNTAGMQPLVPYFLGAVHPEGNRLVDFQKCLRTGDIDQVGDDTHLTFFEMLGNWSLGDYFKEDSIKMSFQFLTDSQYLNIPIEKLSVSVFSGDQDAPCDKESADIWASVGIPKEHIYYFGKSENWWGPAGKTGPCGPDTEIFYDTGKFKCSESCNPSCNCGKYVEIWNNVFMQYNKKSDGSFEPLEKYCVDTGMGLERTAAILQGAASVYQTEVFLPLIKHLETLTGKSHDQSPQIERCMRIISDHIKASIFILGDPKGVSPSNVGAGYVLRRLLRRAIRFSQEIGLNEPYLSSFVPLVLGLYKESYPYLVNNSHFISSEILSEEEKFSRTLQKGKAEFLKRKDEFLKNSEKKISGKVAFHLYDTYGFPLELTQELAEEEGLSVDKEDFYKCFLEHQENSKKNLDKTFKGGLADNSELTTRLHTATHLLHKALQIVLGDHVRQKGSNITPERLRFDFSHHQKMTNDEIQKVERIVNEQINLQLNVTSFITTVQEAKLKGAMALFSDKYGEQITLYSIGDFSLEVCGGPHVKNTKELGKFKIEKEQSVSSGVRRIRAVLI